ncbi:hypothetical protein SDC9_158677 [bioreactor metagenome]|uniref:Uncharacterized protein n=1 Tax=bioreactor metagenome TaxID=1076179 RepID=A0A645FCL3_9ZZZZ
MHHRIYITRIAPLALNIVTFKNGPNFFVPLADQLGNQPVPAVIVIRHNIGNFITLFVL